MNYINIPYSCEKLFVNSIVILGRFPNTKWVLKNDWYMYENKQYNGWYFSSIPSNTVLPVEEEDLLNLTIVSSGEYIQHSCPPYDPCYPNHIHDVHHSVEIYLKGVTYTKGQLLWLETGTLYQVKESFRSTSKYEEVIDNFNEDVEAGKLVPITFDVSSLKCINLAINFKDVFGTSEPSKLDADLYLASLNPPITPHEGVTFINTDETSENYNASYMYVSIPDTDDLLLITDYIKIDTIQGIL